MAAMHAPIDDPCDLVLGEERLAGMSESVAAIVLGALSSPGGLLLVAGPSGSGRARTIDAALASRPGANCAVVGEIVSRRTADGAVQSALGGRLVLAAVAAADAVGAITALREWKVEPFLVAATLRAVLAQRRVRRLCPHCRHPVQAPGGLAALLGFDAGAIVWQAPGCGACDGSGYDGETGLYEAIAVDIALRRLIGSGGDPAVIASHAFRDRPDLGGTARAMARDGVISGEDAVRISRGARAAEPAS
jgi:general secretion pathway protein E